MQIDRKSSFALAIAVALFVAGPAQSGNLSLRKLSRCIADSGAVFYGAHWCPYCHKQMETFGDYADRLPYVECYDGPKSEGMNDECSDAGVKSFPTWHYPDGTVTTGAKSPETLAEVTGCTEAATKTRY